MASELDDFICDPDEKPKPRMLTYKLVHLKPSDVISCLAVLV